MNRLEILDNHIRETELLKTERRNRYEEAFMRTSNDLHSIDSEVIDAIMLHNKLSRSKAGFNLRTDCRQTVDWSSGVLEIYLSLNSITITLECDGLFWKQVFAEINSDKTVTYKFKTPKIELTNGKINTWNDSSSTKDINMLLRLASESKHLLEEFIDAYFRDFDNAIENARLL